MKNLTLLLIVISLSMTIEAKVLERVLAVVNGQSVRLTELQDFKIKLKKGLTNHVLFSLYPPNTLNSDKEILDFLLKTKIMDSYIVANDLEVKPEKVELRINEILKSKGANRSILEQSLKREGTSLEDYKDTIKESMEVDALIQKEIISKIKISDDDILDEYIKTSGAKNHIFKYKLSHILILDKDPKAKETIESIDKKIKSGENFALLANKYSQDPNKQKDGLLGEFKSTELRKELLSAVKNLQKTEVSKVTKFPYGYAIIKVLDKKLVSNQVDLETKNQLQQKISARLFKSLLEDWIINEEKKAFITINKI